MHMIVEGYFHLLKIAIALCLALMVVLVFGNVVLRYAFNMGITVSEELSRFLFVWLTFLGAIVAFREHGHLGVDMVVSRLPHDGQEGLPGREPAADALRHLAVPEGQLGADHDQSRREVALGRHLDGHVLRRRRRLQRLGRHHPAARSLSHWSPAGCPTTELVMVKESEEQEELEELQHEMAAHDRRDAVDRRTKSR